ncbi:MAG: Hpt domain-containing protein, partial [Planctomycetes bacterium]|nr:Hpt domain-containing protein [Planctomycetota bacterium]
MISDSIRKKLQTLASDLVMVSPSSTLEEWKAIANKADDLAEEFFAGENNDAQELAILIGAVSAALAQGIIANSEGGVKAVQHLLSVLQGIESPAGMNETLRKQALAEAHLFFRDVKKEETRAQQDATFADDEEWREMLLAIEQRVDELEAGLVALAPPVTDPEVVRAIFRQFHTLKGEGAICGFTALAEFCHSIETELEAARSGGLVLTATIVSALQELAALIRPLVAGAAAGDSADLTAALLEELRQAIAASPSDGNAPDGGAIPAPPVAAAADIFAGIAPPAAPPVTAGASPIATANPAEALEPPPAAPSPIPAST